MTMTGTGKSLLLLLFVVSTSTGCGQNDQSGFEPTDGWAGGGDAGPSDPDLLDPAPYMGTLPRKCVTGVNCVNDGDCEKGERCNTSLKPPTCQKLYCAGAGEACDDPNLYHQEDLFKNESYPFGGPFCSDGNVCLVVGAEAVARNDGFTDFLRYQCWPETGSQEDLCVSQANCAASLVCNSAALGWSEVGVCLAPLDQGGPCNLDKDCFPSLVCNEASTPGSCLEPQGLGGYCVQTPPGAKDDCQKDLDCVGGRCTRFGSKGDTCGGFAGCIEGLVCNQGYSPAKCMSPAKLGGVCFADGDCVAGHGCQEGHCVCRPDCVGRECGDDGCGGSCGTCETFCVDDDFCCVPNCFGRDCGFDGCGGSCGECPDDLACMFSSGLCTDIGLLWVPIPSGDFLMGCSAGDTQCSASETPVHEVSLVSFEMLETEVTELQFSSVTGATPSVEKAGPDFPVENVPREEAQAFCQVVGGRLPSEAEWEYAARAGTTTKYYCGDTKSCLYGIAWFGGTKKNPVKSRDPNSFGLYDMLGNVREWVADWYSSDYYGTSPGQDPTGPDSGSLRVIRGGGYEDAAGGLRVSLRGSVAPSSSGKSLGFRCVRQD